MQVFPYPIRKGRIGYTHHPICRRYRWPIPFRPGPIWIGESDGIIPNSYSEIPSYLWNPAVADPTDGYPKQFTRRFTIGAATDLFTATRIPAGTYNLILSIAADDEYQVLILLNGTIIDQPNPGFNFAVPNPFPWRDVKTYVYGGSGAGITLSAGDSLDIQVIARNIPQPAGTPPGANPAMFTWVLQLFRLGQVKPVFPISVNRIYVANADSNNVSVIDGNTNTIISTVTVGVAPIAVGVNTKTNRVYVANFFTPKNISVIDGNTNAVINTITVGPAPDGIGVNLNTNRIYVTDFSENNVYVIDGNTDTIIATVNVGHQPGSNIGVNPLTNRIYVANQTTDNVSVIDGNTNTVIATITVETPSDPTVDTATNRIFIADRFNGNLNVISGFSNTIITTIKVGEDPSGVGINQITDRIYVANQVTDNVSIVDGNTYTIIATVTVGNRPGRIGVNPLTNGIYVANLDGNNISVIDGNTNTVIATITSGILPRDIGVNP